MPPTPRIRPYKDFLTPAFHKNFILAASALFCLCYLEAVWMGPWNSLIWSWFPLGIVGIRAGLLFLAILLIYLHRLSTLQVGIRTSYSGWDTVQKYALRSTTIATFIYYGLSAYLFSEIYLGCAPDSADLKKTKLIPRTDRTTLNEKPIYFVSYCFFLALVQAGIHLWYDYDRIDMPVTKTKPLASSDQRAHLIVSARTQLLTKLPFLAGASAQRAVFVAGISPFIYSIPWLFGHSIRSLAWGFNRSWAKIFFTLPKSNSLPSTRPFHYSMLLQTFTAGFLLTMLWEFGNAAFTAYVAQEPLKNERPITYESKDPNGSLLTGLGGKKLQTRAYAFWELAYIAQRFEGRRKTIFEDIDRKGGSSWSQILELCLGVINGMSSRIDSHGKPAPAPGTIVEPANDITSLPRMADNLKSGLKEPGDLFAAPKGPTSPICGVARAVGKVAKNYGQSPPEGLSPKLNKLGRAAESGLLTEEQKKVVSSSGIGGLFKDLGAYVLKTQFGIPFRYEYRRTIAATVLGSPYGDVGIIVDAIDSLTRLAVCSLTEDKYGNVQRDVKLIIQTLTATVTKLENFKNTLALHWTDVEGRRESPEVDTILAALKGGVNDLVVAFGDYAENLGLSQSEMRMAREAGTPALLAPATEMEQR